MQRRLDKLGQAYNSLMSLDDDNRMNRKQFKEFLRRNQPKLDQIPTNRDYDNLQNSKSMQNTQKSLPIQKQSSMNDGTNAVRVKKQVTVKESK